MNIKEIFEKQGGKKLVKQYIRSGSLVTAVTEFLLLGKSRTSLEILRLATQLKTKQNLEKKYKKYLIDFEKNYDYSLPHISSNKIWFCWFQGIENAPELVKVCYSSIKKNLKEKEILLITSENMGQYVQFPDYIIEKWKKGIITHTHMTDLLRLALLIQYGGTWVDATVFCSEEIKNIPNYFFDSDLFFYQNLKPGRDGDAYYISSWFMTAKTNNKILMATQSLCYTYWSKNNYMIDYFLLHVFMSIVLDYYKEDWNKIIPCSNATPHILSLRLFDEYDDEIWNAIKTQSPFHKLTYKYNNLQSSKQGTFFNIVLGL